MGAANAPGLVNLLLNITAESDTRTMGVRDDHNQIAGRTSGRFETTRDERRSIVSPDTSDSGLVIPRR
jgi:hypothetical protein